MFIFCLLQIKELISQNPDLVGKSLMKVRLSDKQWEQVHNINLVLTEEYKIRREMLLKRLDVTIQSFMWSDKAKVRHKCWEPVRFQFKAL